MKYRKRPVVVEAYQTAEVLDIPTLEGVMHANPGDWIITGVKGEKYPCKPDIFEATYEAVPPDNCCGAIGCPGGITLYCKHASYLAGQMTTTTRDGRVYLQTIDQGFKCALGHDTAWVAWDGCEDFEKREDMPRDFGEYVTTTGKDTP